MLGRAPIKARTDRTNPSVWRTGKPKTSRKTNAVSIATSENRFCPPGRPEGDGRHAPGRSAAPRRDHHHRGASRHVGDRRRAGVHGGRRLGLDLRGGRPLERGVRRVARVQGRQPVRRPRTHRARPSSAVRLGGRRCRPRVGPADGPWQPISSRTTSSIRSGTGASVPASASSRNPKRTASRSGGTARSRSKRSTVESFSVSTTCAPPSPTSSSGTTRAGASRRLAIRRRSKRARRTSYARPRSANVCPRNRVRYTCPPPAWADRELIPLCREVSLIA